MATTGIRLLARTRGGRPGTSKVAWVKKLDGGGFSFGDESQTEESASLLTIYEANAIANYPDVLIEREIKVM